VKINVQDLELLMNMANRKNIDYIEIDRILNSMFTPVKKNLFEFKSTDDYNYMETYYDQVRGICIY